MVDSCYDCLKDHHAHKTIIDSDCSCCSDTTCTFSAFAVENGEKDKGNIHQKQYTARNAPPEGAGNDDPPLPENSENMMDQLTRSQRRHVEALDNVITYNLTEGDFSGTLRDLQGNPVPKPGGGYYDHRTEMVQSHIALK